MAIIHISEADAARDFAALLAKVRAGEEVSIEDGDERIAVLKAPMHHEKPRLASDILAGLERRGSTATLPLGFAAAVEDGNRSHESDTLPDPWE